MNQLHTYTVEAQIKTAIEEKSNGEKLVAIDLFLLRADG